MKRKSDDMRLITTKDGYNFWVGIEKDEPFYNITPIDQKKPGGGYFSSEYICKVKGVHNYFKEM